MKLADRVCVITGGARGIGEAIATRFIAEGATVAILDLDRAAAESTAGRLGATAYQCDVSSRASVENAINAVLYAHGRVDVLCNNAGIGLAGRPPAAIASPKIRPHQVPRLLPRSIQRSKSRCFMLKLRLNRPESSQFWPLPCPFPANRGLRKASTARTIESAVCSRHSAEMRAFKSALLET